MTLKALLVGAGGMGRAWAKMMRYCDDVHIGGWVDVQADLAAQGADELKLSNLYTGTDFEQALAGVQPDFVVDVTIPEAHHNVTIASLTAGVPVLGEKPMADSMEHARAMVAASERAEVLYMVSQSRRYNAQLHALRRFIDTRIGRLGILNSDFYIGAHFGGFRDKMPSPLILDMAIHTFDAARFLSNADPVAVYCEEFNPSWSWYKGDACATALFEMTDGLRYTYRGSWCSEGCHTSWEGEWRAVGSYGSAVWDGSTAPQAAVVQQRGGFFSETESQTMEPEPDFVEGIEGALRDFLRALKTGATPMGECHDNIKSLAMVFGAIESAQTGQRVILSQL
ncbi:MAG: Gfo/Idh/MocA family oxidoreductase [Chloroflexota bacterium]